MSTAIPRECPPSVALRLALALLAVLSATPPARAATSYIYPGQLCQWYAGNDPALKYDASGLINTLSGAGTRGALCAIPVTAVLGQTLTIDSVAVHYYDASTTDAVSCTVEEVNWDGGLHWSTTQTSCSTWGGCGYPGQGAYTGMGSIVFNKPIAATNQYPIGMSVYCLVPNGSRIFGYNATLH